jgi:outer membrane protein TolC
MKKSLLILSFAIIPGFTSMNAQRILTLRECYEGASAASAIAGEKDSYFGIWQLKDRIHAKGWLPSLDAGGSFIYNSEVIDIGNSLGSLPVPGIADAIKPLPHEQYKLTVDINQVIYDGGAIKGARAIEKADLKVNQKQTEADLYKLRSQINTYYFNLMLLDRQKDLLVNYLELMEKRISSMESAVRNGVILRSDIDVMQSEKIRLEQQLKENEIRRDTFIKILSDLTRIQIDQSCELTPPVFSQSLSPDLSRPELDIFDLRKEQLDAAMQVIDSKRRPKAFGFATLGYGNPPGNNFFRDEFDTYYIVGAGIKWNIFDWNKAKNEKQVISLQKGMIDNRKNDLADNFSHLLEGKNAEISSLELLIWTDEELVALRKRITASAESQYENGTITATELLNEINSERQALINHELHKVSLAMAKVEYLNISGKEIE